MTTKRTSPPTDPATRRFLRERGLSSTFRRFQKLKSVKKRTFVVTQDGVSHRVKAFRDGKRTVVVDAFSLRTLATTTKFNVSQVRGALEKKKVGRTRFSGKVFTGVQHVVRLKEISRTPLTNVVQVERTAPLGKKLGKIFVSITFVSANGETVTTQGGSRRLRILSVAAERRTAFDEAFQGALSQINFSYVTARINWVHFNYFVPRRRPQLSVQTAQAPMIKAVG